LRAFTHSKRYVATFCRICLSMSRSKLAVLTHHHVLSPSCQSHCGFGAAWAYLVAFKSYSSRKRFYANTAEIELAIQKRTVRTKSGQTPLRYFDGATMVSYQMPSRSMENVFCRREPTPPECGVGEYHYNPELSNVPTSSMEVKVSGQGEKAGRGVYTLVDIAKDTYISAETASQSLRFFPSTHALIIELLTKCPEQAEALEGFEYYMYGYGFSSRKLVSCRFLFVVAFLHVPVLTAVIYSHSCLQGDHEVFVDSSIITFVNHGCKGSYNVGAVTDEDEFGVDLKAPAEEGKSHTGTSVFNPVIDRHLFFSGDSSIRDIKAGEEILDNYLVFIGGEEAWEYDVMQLRQQCSGEDTKLSVTEYENSAKHK